MRLEYAQRRRQDLLERFEDEQIVNTILAQGIWHDMTKEQLIESWGAPEAIDTKVLKTKIKETYKYDQVGVNRYARRVFLENHAVVGWQK